MARTTQDLENWRPPEKTRASRTRARAPQLSREALLAACPPNDEITQKELADALQVRSAAVGKAAQAAIEAGELIQTSGRPKRYRRVHA